MSRRGDSSLRMKHCPKCCPKKWENVHGVTGTVSHSYEPEDEDDLDSQWGWRCTNCRHFKKPRMTARRRRYEERFNRREDSNAIS
jgi:hypothetical protein